MHRIIIFLLLLLPATCFSQFYINKTKSQVKKQLEKKILEKNSIPATIKETDSTLSVQVRGAGITEADYIYSFDRSGKCSTEKTVTWCDSCLEKLLQPVLSIKKYQWKKININQYVSEYSAGMFIEIQATGNTHYFTIFRLNFSRKMYNFLLDNQ